MKNPLICYERICRMRFGGIANMSLLSPNAHAPDSAKDNSIHSLKPPIAEDPIQEFFGVERSEATEFLIRIRSALTSSPRTA